MSKDTEYIATLIEFTVSEDNERVDLEACLEVSDRANATKAECLEAIRCITKCLGKSSVKVVLNTLQLLETMCKNCNMRFLYELNNKKLVEALLKFLQRRRDRSKYGTKAPKSSNPLKTDAEDKILYLIQLWADTFMMHQAEFRNIHDAYRNLRKDGVLFPERDPNQKFMINFQGQVSPVFLAMENNVTVPSNNQGGPMSDLKKSTNYYKPKTTEYKHEYTSKVQNTLYDENDEDYDYSAYDGIQITAEEVRILEESIGILKEIERNATKPADMKGEIAKEILSDLVHVHKRLKRFIKSERFASPSQKNEAIKLNQLLSSCLSSYKTKYYKLKDEQRRVRTEPDEDHRVKYKEEEEETNYHPKNAGRLQTEVDDNAYNERIRPSDLIDGKKNGTFKKANFMNNKLAPPTGWKVPNQDLGSNPDLIDLLNTRDNNKTQQTSQKKKEEKKEAAPTLLTDLLDLNFSTSTAQTKPQKAEPVVDNRRCVTSPQDFTNFDAWDMAASQTSSNNINFTNFENPIDNTNSKIKSQGTIPGKGNANSPFAFTQPQMNSPQKVAVVENKQQNVNLLDDDDFFSDIANRKK